MRTNREHLRFVGYRVVMHMETKREQKREVLAALRDGVRRLERGGVASQSVETKGFSLLSEELAIIPAPPQIDKGALHEIRGSEHRDRPAAFGFLLALIARSWATPETGEAADTRPVLWCEDLAGSFDFGRLYAPGLKAFGLDPERFIIVRAKGADELLWAMEEGVRSGSLSAVVGAFGGTSSSRRSDLDLTASRRLQLAAERTGTTAFLLRQPSDDLASVARTRWLISARPSGRDVKKSIIGLPRWQVSLSKCRGARPGTWDMEWNYATHHFHLVPTVENRPVLPEYGSSGEPQRGTVTRFRRTG